MRATIKDVATAAGVSIKTVSRVLNNERYVGAETRERVETAVATLHFRPAAAVRSIPARGTAGPVVALFYDVNVAHAVLGTLAGAQARCAAAGGRVIAQPCDAASAQIAEAVAALADAFPLDGAILLPPLGHRPEVLAALAQRGVRAVTVGPDGMPSVGCHDAPAAAVMTRHLLALGHRRIGFVGAAGDAGSEERARGHRAALAAAGIADDPGLTVDAMPDFAGGARAGAALLERAEVPSAIFAASDTIAAGVLTAAHARGLGVPEDLSVVGFGDEALAAYVWPPLTTIRVSAQALGSEAVDLLLSGSDARRDIAFELVERASAVGTGL